MSLVFDPTDRDLKKKVQQLAPTPGYCIIADIVGSTQMKDQSVPSWAARIFNTFSLLTSYLHVSPLKSIGDALMFYIPEAELSRTASPLQIFFGLCLFVQEKDSEFSTAKAAITYCTNAYELTFVRGTHDIYGKDIDLTARLLGTALEREIVMNAPFVEQLRANHAVAANRDDFPDVPKIEGPWSQLFKGFPDYVTTYKLPAGGSSFQRHMS